LFIYKDEVNNNHEGHPKKEIAKFLLFKYRNGQTGVAILAFLSEFNRFDNLANEYD